MINMFLEVKTEEGRYVQCSHQDRHEQFKKKNSFVVLPKSKRKEKLIVLGYNSICHRD